MFYVVADEVSHDRTMFLVIHVCYVDVSKIFHDRTMALVNPRVSHWRPRRLLGADRVSHNPRGLRRRPRGFSRSDHASRTSTCIIAPSPKFWRPDHVSSNHQFMCTKVTLLTQDYFQRNYYCSKRILQIWSYICRWVFFFSFWQIF